MQELPEKNTPLSQPEDEASEEETAPVAGLAGEPASEQTRENETVPEATSSTSPAEEEPPAQAEAQPEQPGATGGAEGASGSEEVAEPAPQAAAETVTSASGRSEDRVTPTIPEPSRPTPQPVPSDQPERAEAEAALQGEGTRAENPEETNVLASEEAVPEAPAGQPAAETAAPPAAQVDAPTVTEEEGQPNLDELAVTASGAVMVPGEEAPRAEEPRPKRAPARPEKPTGPRISDLRPGQVVEGTVTRLEKYGAFVNLGLVDRRDGLIHISEMSPHRIRRVEDVVQVGDSVRARIVSVDLGRGRIALSLNDVDADSTKEASVGPSEPTLTSMEMAFRDAQNRQREREARGSTAAGEGKEGERKRREQEELMRRLQEGQ